MQRTIHTDVMTDTGYDEKKSKIFNCEDAKHSSEFILELNNS